ncbi:hypothetical protein PG993_007129 [Apiospora rasikravindrae]|uniref:Copper transport protein n=1 Tax=Apiospora rasikravindrae TaxID=990691 RepID=A0ABR1SYV5_9PEZI
MDNMGISTTAAAAAATSTATPTDVCKVNLLWNWDTIDTCFLAPSWYNNSTIKFAFSCIFVFIFAVTLQVFYHSLKTFDAALLLKEHNRRESRDGNQTEKGPEEGGSCCCRRLLRYSPSVWEQTFRAFVYTMTFANAYILMLSVFIQTSVSLCKEEHTERMMGVVS